MEVTGQLDASATLSALSTHRMGEWWNTEPLWTLWRRQNSPEHARITPQFNVYPAHSQITTQIMISTFISDLKYCKLLPNFKIHYNTKVYKICTPISPMHISLNFKKLGLFLKFFNCLQKMYHFEQKRENIMKSTAFGEERKTGIMHLVLKMQ